VFIQKLKKTPGVELLGFVENLEELFDNVRMAVVPIFHGTGLINRILDNLTAGVPMVSTPNAISTFESLESGEHILSASSARLFADQVIALYSDRTLRLELSNKGRDYVLSNHPDWNTSGGRIADKMALVLEKTHSRFLKE
jgi:glycosyltransferase involved in cell wall biosynthesis